MYCLQLLIILSLLWAGMILGISLAAWAKFKAPHLSHSVGLEIGQIEFCYFQWIQCAINLAIIVLTGFTSLQVRYFPLLLIAIFTMGLFLQIVWLYPQLQHRAQKIINSDTPPKSSIHLLYVFLEFSKLITLIYFSILLIRISS